MAHVAKYTRGALGHMFAHYERAKGKDNEYIKFEMKILIQAKVI